VTSRRSYLAISASIGRTARRTAHLRGLAVDLMLPAALT
jgi:hypothetical protein